MRNQLNLWLAAFGFLLTCTACGNDTPPPEEPNLLRGAWTIDRATRNDRTTETLRGMFFRFDERNMSTNMLGEPLEAPYTLDGSSIEHQLPGFDAAFTVPELTDSTLTLTTRMRGYDFEFFLKRTVEERSDPPVEPTTGEEI